MSIFDCGMIAFIIAFIAIKHVDIIGVKQQATDTVSPDDEH